jgi:adenylate cyclase
VSDTDAEQTEPDSAAVFVRAADILRAAGLPDDELAEAMEAGPDELIRTVARYLTFPGRRYLRKADVYARTGVSPSTADSLWQAMGFPHAPPDSPVFTDADVDALRVSVELFERAGMTFAAAQQQARAMSQATMRIASSHQDVIAALVADPDPLANAASAVTLAEDTLPALDHLLVYLYRRHLSSATEQQLLASAAGPGATTVAVGFADLARFTETTELFSVDELAQIIEHFNAAAAAAVVEGGGRVIKTIGDEVMFTANDARAGAAIGLGLLEVISPTTGYPALRVGLATGEVLAREGDVFGPAVNLASRLVTMARPDTMLVDSRTRDAIAAESEFHLKAVAPRPAKGVDRLRCWRLRSRAPDVGATQ